MIPHFSDPQDLYAQPGGPRHGCPPPLTNNLKIAKNGFKVEIPLIVLSLEEFTREPVTLADHLRRRRIELDLYQKEVAAKLDVTTSTIWNWENTGSVYLRFIPQVINFLGYNSIPQPEDLLKKLAWYKRVNGLSLEKLGTEMGRDPEQLADWLSGRYYPCRKNLGMFDKFLAYR
ncbi:MAG: helix-turn-helix domain-containing protein [Desulfuromusa sp.]|nr:helix-turn-helix domain-containing protein [Desulfuromusa sp.]